MNRQLCIRSYFSLPTDLAGEMRDWSEFVSGAGYNVDLCDKKTGESVCVHLVEHQGDVYVAITSTGCGTLFDRVAGRVIHALSAHTDNMMVDRHVPVTECDE